MGEYISYKGDHFKLGACEDLYYVTFPELEEIVAVGASQLPGNLAPAEYLREKNGFRFRFPFPDEKPHSDHSDDYDRGLIVNVGPSREFLAPEHYTISRSLGPRGADHHISAKITCPISPDAKPDNYSYGPGAYALIAEIVQQRPIDGHLWTVLRCPYCGARYRLGPEEAAALVAHIRTLYCGELGIRAEYAAWDPKRAGYFWAQVADTIEAGYSYDTSCYEKP